MPDCVKSGHSCHCTDPRAPAWQSAVDSSVRSTQRQLQCLASVQFDWHPQLSHYSTATITLTLTSSSGLQAEIASSLATCATPLACANLRTMQTAPSAFWVDTKSKILGANATSKNSVAAVLADASKHAPAPALVVFIVYDLPNRDCAAHSSNGEICCAYNVRTVV